MLGGEQTRDEQLFAASLLLLLIVGAVLDVESTVNNQEMRNCLLLLLIVGAVLDTESTVTVNSQDVNCQKQGMWTNMLTE